MFCKIPLIYPFDSVSPVKLDNHIFVNCMCKGDTFNQVLICSLTISEWRKLTVWICDSKTCTLYDWLITWDTNSPTPSICRHVTKCVCLHWFRRVNFIDAIFITSAWIIPQYLRTIDTFLFFLKENVQEFLYAYDIIFYQSFLFYYYQYLRWNPFYLKKLPHSVTILNHYEEYCQTSSVI